MNHQPVTSLLLLTVFYLAGLPSARACNVPVFRYALERWDTEPYELFIFHRTPLSPDQEQLINTLTDAEQGRGTTINLQCRVTAISSLPPMKGPSVDETPPASNSSEDPALVRAARIWSAQPHTSTLHAVLLAPHNTDQDPVWSGPLTQETAARLLSSPARDQLAQRLLSGESAVWLLLESGQQDEDERAAHALEQGLNAVQSKLKLPPPAPDDPQLHADLPLRIAFSLLRVSRTDPEEEILVRSLSNGEPGLSSTPVAFPVFGQGRILAAITSADLTPHVIQEASAFMTGPCSCEVKDLNPGKDLLLAADWMSIFNKPVAGVPSNTPITPPSPPSPAKQRLLLSATILLLLAGLGAVVVLRRSRHPQS